VFGARPRAPTSVRPRGRRPLSDLEGADLEGADLCPTSRAPTSVRPRGRRPRGRRPRGCHGKARCSASELRPAADTRQALEPLQLAPATRGMRHAALIRLTSTAGLILGFNWIIEPTRNEPDPTECVHRHIFSVGLILNLSACVILMSAYVDFIEELSRHQADNIAFNALTIGSKPIAL